VGTASEQPCDLPHARQTPCGGKSLAAAQREIPRRLCRRSSRGLRANAPVAYRKDSGDERFGNYRDWAKRLAGGLSATCRSQGNLYWLQTARRGGERAGRCGRFAGSDELRKRT